MSSALTDQMVELAGGVSPTGFSPAALDNFSSVFAISPKDRVLLLLDNEIDPEVARFIWEFARGRGAQVASIVLPLNGSKDEAFMAASWSFPEQAKPMIAWATFVVSSWFSSATDPFFNQLRAEQGQRWVKISYFRDLRMLATPAASFPLDVLSLLLQKTAAFFPTSGNAILHVSDSRGTDITIDIPEQHIHRLILNTSRWKGEVTAEEPGCFIHYVPTHGPNLYLHYSRENDGNGANGVLLPQWGVGFEDPFETPLEIFFQDNVVTAVSGESTHRAVLEEMIVGCSLIELGCGFNPKWPRDQIYPAGSNSAGALHFGLNLPTPSEFIRTKLPHWVEPPVHVDLVTLDSSVTINGQSVIEGGRLVALDDPEVQALASNYGDPVELLMNWPFINDSLDILTR